MHTYTATQALSAGLYSLPRSDLLIRALNPMLGFESSWLFITMPSF